MTDVLDFLSFRRYVSPYALVFFYYTGAVLMPLAAVIFWLWLKRRLPALLVVQRQMDDLRRTYLSTTQQVGIFVFCLFCFLFAELFWRMLFEFLLAYFQMAIDLQKLAH